MQIFSLETTSLIMKAAVTRTFPLNLHMAFLKLYSFLAERLSFSTTQQQYLLQPYFLVSFSSIETGKEIKTFPQKLDGVESQLKCEEQLDGHL